MSSSSSAEFSRPCPKNGLYDIFLSFRGEDTRYGFTANLYRSLRESKVYTFMDVKLTGEDIDYLFEMVAKSRMAVVIYSQTFASSDWCLTELEMILQRRKEKKMLMIPIFYKVDVHELKHLSGKTAEYLDKHIQEHGEAIVKKWKDSITSLGKISGLSYKDTHGRYEYDFIMDVIATIKEKLGEYEETLGSGIIKNSNDTGNQDNIMKLMGITSQLQQEHRGSSTAGEVVYGIVTSACFQKSKEITVELLNMKPAKLNFIVEPKKESSTCLSLLNKTDNYVAFRIHLSHPVKYRISLCIGLVLPRSTCEVIVTMVAQSVLPPDMKCGDKFLVQSVITKNDEATAYDLYEMLENESENAIDECSLEVVYVTPRHQVSSVPDNGSVANGLVQGLDQVMSIDLHPTKPWVLLCWQSGSVTIWNQETRAEEKSFKVSITNTNSAKFVSERHWIVVGDNDGFVRVFDYDTSKMVKEFKAHENTINCVAVHPTSPFVLTASGDGLIKLWNWENNWACDETFARQGSDVIQVAFNPKDSTSFASVCADGSIKIWSHYSSIEKFTIAESDTSHMSVEYFVGNDDKLYLLSGCYEKCAQVWDYESRTLVKTLEGHKGFVMANLVNHKLPIIITTSDDETVRIWNKNTYQLELVWNCDFGRVWNIRFIKSTNEVVLGCDKGMIVMKIVENGTRSD